MRFLADGHQKAYVCTHVFEGSKPILLVSRPDGDWCFLCGEEHEDSASAYEVVGIGHVVELDASIRELCDLPANWDAERESPGHPWACTPFHTGKS